MACVSTSMVVMILGIIVIASTSLTQATNTSKSFEGEALLRWRDSLSAYANRLASWNTTNPCDNWSGVTCNGEGRVIGIDLPDYYYRLEGTLYSFNFSSFPFLSTLTLAGDNLSGKIPHEIGTLSQLTHLDLSSTSYYAHNGPLSGQLPLSFANLTKLTHLDLSGNFFEGELTLPFSLTHLDLSWNNFSGKLPLSFSNLNNLTYLDLSQNFFHGKLIPLSFANINNLTYLDLSLNDFQDQVPLQLPLKLTHLDLSDNKLRGKLPLSLGDLTELTHLDLSHNSFSGQLPPSLLNCVQLVTLLLQSNHFSGRIPPQYGYLKYLTEFVLADNQISGPIPVEIMNLQSLSLLDLSNNKLTGPIPRTIGNLYQLVELELQVNYISGTLPQEIGRLSNLTILNLAHNSLHGMIPSQIANLANLVNLDISRNSLAGAVPHQLPNMVKLCSLDLSHNKLSGIIDCSVCKMAYRVGCFRTIDLSSNSFKGRANRYTNGLVNSVDGPCDYLNYYDECLSTPEVPQQITLKRHKGVMFIVVISSILSVIFLSLTILGIRYIRRKSKMKMEKQVELGQQKNGNLLSLWNYDGRIAYEDIITATEDFDLKYCIGVGGYGSVYKAILPSGKAVALKKLHRWEAQEQACEKSFENEIKFLTTIRHRNIVRLYGFCSNPQCMFLIYEYMERGSLYCVLSNEAEAVELGWSERVSIIKGVSYALSYMHHDCNPPILHRDISATMFY